MNLPPSTPELSFRRLGQCLMRLVLVVAWHPSKILVTPSANFQTCQFGTICFECFLNAEIPSWSKGQGQRRQPLQTFSSDIRSSNDCTLRCWFPIFFNLTSVTKPFFTLRIGVWSQHLCDPDGHSNSRNCWCFLLSLNLPSRQTNLADLFGH